MAENRTSGKDGIFYQDNGFWFVDSCAKMKISRENTSPVFMCVQKFGERKNTDGELDFSGRQMK